MSNPIQWSEVEAWLVEKRETMTWLAATLGVSKSTPSRWSKGDPIPEPSQHLLKLLIRGEMPFSFSVRPNMMRFTPQEWRAIEILRIREGFETSHDWIAAKIRAYLAMSKTMGVRYPTADDEPFSQSAKVAEGQ